MKIQHPRRPRYSDRVLSVLVVLAVLCAVGGLLWLDRVVSNGEGGGTTSSSEIDPQDRVYVPAVAPPREIEDAALLERVLAFEKAYLTPGVAERYEAVKPYVTKEYLATLDPFEMSARAHDFADEVTLSFDDERSIVTGKYDSETKAHFNVCAYYTRKRGDISLGSGIRNCHTTEWEKIDGEWFVVVEDH